MPIFEIDKQGMIVTLLCGTLLILSSIIALTVKNIYGILVLVSAFGMSVIIFLITAQIQQIKEAKKKN